MSSLDPRLDPHQHAKSLLSVDVPASFILISSLEHIAPETPRAVMACPSGYVWFLMGPVWHEHCRR